MKVLSQQLYLFNDETETKNHASGIEYETRFNTNGILLRRLFFSYNEIDRSPCSSCVFFALTLNDDKYYTH